MIEAATLTSANGPADPPSSRPGAGVLGGQVFAYHFSPAAGEQRVTMLDPALDTDPVSAVTELNWAFYAEGEVAWPYPSLAVTVDVLFDDGSRLSTGPGGSGVAAVPPVDRYGFELQAEAQFSARWSMPEQWNANTVALGAWAGRRITAVECVLGADSLKALSTPIEAHGFVEMRLVERRPPAECTPAEQVDTRRGTHSGDRFSRGNTIPAVAVPHGFNLVTPATDAADSRWPYRPFVHDDKRGRRLQALQFSHQPSPWIGDRGVLQLMPFSGQPRSRRSARTRWIRPGSEEARPYLYAAELDGGLRVEFTVSDHAAAFRVRSEDETERVGFVFDQLENRGCLTLAQVDDGRVRLSGWVAESDPEWGNGPRMYFSGESTGPVEAFGALNDAGRGSVAGHLSAHGTLEVRIATSFISIEQAQRSLNLEASRSQTFEAIRDAAHEAWNRVLSCVSVPPLPAQDRAWRGLAHDEQLTNLYSNLYRLHLYPSNAAENTGTADAPRWCYADVFTPPAAHGESRTGAPIASGRLAVNNGYWDTYRTAWPMIHLIDPVLAGALLDGQLEQYRRGGFMARWSAPGYVDSMVGTSSDQIFADAARWGVNGFDAELGFDSGWRNACEPSPHPRAGRKGIARARFTGYVSRDIHEGMSWSLENAVSDAGLARFASLLAARSSTATPEEAGVQANDGASRYRAYSRYFANRALSYRQLFDPHSGFFRGKDALGAFPSTPLDPRVWGGDYVETNAWGMSVTPVHDGAGLAALHGGPDALGAHLDRLFAEPETARLEFAGSYGTVIHEQREARAQRSGMCALSNQPAHHIPFTYVHSDRPWRSAPLVHGLAERLFTGGHIGQGYPGDEDNGEMSAWWLWAAIGLYPLELGSGELLIGSPLFDDVTVYRANAGRLRVHARRESPTSRHLTAVHVNGVPLTQPILSVDMLAADCDLELWFQNATPRDSPLWYVTAPEVVPWCSDLTRTEWTIASAEISHPERAFDDGATTGDASVVLAPGEWIGNAFDEPKRVTDITVTAAADVAANALSLEYSHHGHVWHALPLTHSEELPPNRTTPFSLVDSAATASLTPPTARLWRLRAMVPVHLRQIEFFSLAPTPEVATEAPIG